MTESKKLNFEDIKIGDSASFERVISNEDIIKFAEISGDYNPLHLDDDYARKTEFGTRIAHGMLLGALISRLVGMELPGKKCLLIKECLEFKKPARVLDRLTISGRVEYISKSTRIIEIDVEIKNEKKELIVSGSVHVRVLK